MGSRANRRVTRNINSTKAILLTSSRVSSKTPKKYHNTLYTHNNLLVIVIETYLTLFKLGVGFEKEHKILVSIFIVV